MHAKSLTNLSYTGWFIFLAVSIFVLLAIQLFKPRLAHADPTVVYVSGTLTANQTWTNDNLYYITGAVTVPDGKTLTINAGTIVKVNGSSAGISVHSGGMLDVNGIH